MNPATRLYAILRTIKNLPGNNRPLRHVIAEIFGIPDKNSPEVIRSYVTVLSLALDVEARIKAIPGMNHELYSRGIGRIQSRFATASLDVDLNGFRNQLAEEDLHSIEFVADLLSGIESEKEIAPDVLKTLIEKLDSFLEELKSIPLDPDFRHFLYSNLSAVRLAIQNYRFFGASGIRGAMARVIGELILDPREMQSDQKKSLLRRAIETIKDINQVITFTRNGVEVAKHIHLEEVLKIGG